MDQPRILIVEDDVSMRTSMTMVFRRKGYHVDTTSSGSNALEKARESNYHVGMLDIKLPDMDGVDLLRPLKEINPEMVLIMITGYASIETAVRAMNAGASAYITKPINMDEVLAAIREALEKQRLTEEKRETEKALKASEERYRTIFNTTPVSIWEEDFSEAKKAIDDLKNKGITDLHTYLDGHPEFLDEIIQKINILNVNQATIKMFKAKNREHLLGSLDKITLPETRKIIRDELIAIAKGRTFFEGETVNQTLLGENLDVMISMAIQEGGSESVNVLISMMDITERKRAANELKARNAEIRMLYQAGIKLGASLKLEDVYETLRELLVQVMGCDGLYISAYDKDSQTIRCEAAWGDGKPLDVAIFPTLTLEPDGKGTQSLAIRTGETIYLPDYLERVSSSEKIYYINHDNSSIQENQNGEEDITRSAIIAPLKFENQVLGVIQVFSYKENAYRKEHIDFLNALAPQVAIAMGNAKLFEQAQLEIKRREEAERHTQRQFERMSALHSIDMAISSSFDLKVTMDILLSQVTFHLDVDAAMVLLLNPQTQRLEYVAGKGFRRTRKKYEDILLGQGYAGKAALDQKIVQIEDLGEDNMDLIRSDMIRSEGFLAYFGIPLIAKNQVVGVLEIFQRKQFQPEADWLDFLETLAGQAAIAIDNSSLFSSLQRANLELELAYDNTLEGWSSALELRDMETEGHSQRVTAMTVKLAQMKGIVDEEVVQIKRGALLHDIGKMGVPDNILLKPGPLTDEEWEIMRQHPVYAYRLLSPIPFLQDALDIPYYHHERWDGSGYPKGLKGEEIPLAARIFAVADVFDALSSDRPYRSAWGREEVINYIKEQAGMTLDPQIVDCFIKLLDIELEENLA